VGPDTTNPNPTGYAGGQRLLRFSHTHVSGTGGGGRYGNIGVVPLPRGHNLNPFAFEVISEVARPGYYRAELEPGRVTAELTSTRRCALHRYQFQGSTGHFGLDTPHIVIDPCSAIDGVATDAEVFWTDARTCEGFGTIRGGWGHDEPYTVFFSIAFRTLPVRRHCRNGVVRNPAEARGPGSVAVAGFASGSTVELDVGISFVSVAKARANRESEIAGRSLDEIVRESGDQWEELFERFHIETSDPWLRTLYYTMLYRLFAMPDDLGTDECPWFPNRKRQFNNFYCLWDSVRNANSFFALWMPEFQSDIVNSLLEIGEHTGWCPDAWIMGHSAQVQGGSSGDVLFLEAAIKKLPGFDPRQALDCMLRERATASPDPFFFGRYPDYFSLGYLPDGVPQGVSRTIEYAFQDDCLARLADLLGEGSVAAEARARAANLWHLWRDDLKSFAPKSRDGCWVEPFDPWNPVRPDFWNDPWFYEGTGHDWSLTVLHDMPELIRRHGGPAGFSAHLDQVLDRGFFLWKEIILHVPWMYHWTGEPERSARRIRECLHAHFRPGRAGLSDNEDMGSQSSFAIGALTGIYPVMGSDLYLLAPPLVDEVCWRVGTEGRSLRVRHDPKAEGITWNGVRLDRAWLRHHELVGGGELIFGDGLPSSAVK
jgi:predicted alpha-1,2-mannosidase